ncbi:MAG: hypothetical protein B7Z80_05165 [Rhodospirillales bacterium 20-64-7]|nr:MAG: hypothetical protein B7Z80_05165 [Rhodospirillales bacterium 20-64-7]HQT76346.1 hypothetical protein [Rhodopila sp.]
MMRIGFLPSDFNPMILMLGEGEDCRALGGALRRFAREQQDVAFQKLRFCQCRDIGLRLTAQPGPEGVQRLGRTGFIWRLTAERAAGFADRLEDLGEPGRVAGSETLDAGTEDGISIKVSRGEYTDDFLSGPGGDAG